MSLSMEIQTEWILIRLLFRSGSALFGSLRHIYDSMNLLDSKFKNVSLVIFIYLGKFQYWLKFPNI